MTAPRRLDVASVREPRPRVRRHQVMAAVVAAYLVAALVVVAGAVARPRWLALHLLGLGAATNAVFVWSRHFAQAVLHARLRSERVAHARLVLLNAGVVGVLVGVQTGTDALAGLAAAAVALAVGGHVASLAGMTRTFRLPGPLRPVVWFYVAAGTCLVAGAVLGGVMAAGLVADDSVAQRRLHLAHAQLNVLGWIGLAVLGSEVVLWPAVLRTRMPERTPAVAPWILAACGTGLLVLVTGVSTGSTAAEVAGCSGYAAGVLLAAERMLRTLPARVPAAVSAWSLAAATAWLTAGVVVDGARLATGTDPDQVLRPLVPMLGVGLVAQALVGALTFLLPVTVGGGPAGNRRLASVLERGGRTRTAVGNAGLLFVVLPGPHAMHVAGWVGALTGFGSFLPLLVVALTIAARRG